MTGRLWQWMLAYLVLLAAASAWFADTAWKSVTGYQSPYALDRQFGAGPALVERAVLVVLDGLRADRVSELPSFAGLAARGASGVMRTTEPSLSYPARAALVSGASPEVSGVTTNAASGPVPVQSLLGLAGDLGMRVAVFGSGFWPRAFGPGMDHRRFGGRLPEFTPVALARWQDESCEQAVDHLRSADAQFQVIDVMAGDEAGHEFGGASDAYIDVIAAVDRCLGRIVDAAGPDTVVLGVSDHGHIDRWGKGGHGGLEPEVMAAPFAMAGPRVAVTGPLDAEIVDIAPTLSMLLGLPIPANSQGRVIWEALEVQGEQRSRLEALERTQRTALAAHLPDRDAALAANRSRRLPWAILAVLWFVSVAALAARRQDLAGLAIAVAVFAAAYAALFFVFQLGTSISASVRQEYLNGFLARNIAATGLAFVAAALFLVSRVGRNREVAVRLAAILTSIFGLAVAAVHGFHGLRMEGFMLELGPGFKAYLNLFAIVGLALGAVGVSLAMPRLPRFGRGRS